MSYSITTKSTWTQTSNELEAEFRRWNIFDWEINYPKGARSTKMYQTEEERTVTLRFKKRNGKEVNLIYGKQARAVDNLRALYLTINDMRMTEVRGVSDLVESAYKQLGNGQFGGTNASTIIVDELKSPYEILGIREDATLEAAEAVYRTMARKYHPDVYGSDLMIKQLNLAIERIRAEKREVNI